MKTKKLTSVVIASMLALSLNFVGASQAQAAACSAKDKYKWDHVFVEGQPESFMGLYAFAGVVGDEESISAIFDLLESWQKTTKNKKLKAALKKFEVQFEIHGASGYKYSAIPELTKEYNAINTMFKFNRC